MIATEMEVEPMKKPQSVRSLVRELKEAGQDNEWHPIRRFYFHYRKFDKLMSVHFDGFCIPCKQVWCKVPCQSKRNKRQPFLVMQGYCTRVRYIKTINTVVIS